VNLDVLVVSVLRLVFNIYVFWIYGFKIEATRIGSRLADQWELYRDR